MGSELARLASDIRAAGRDLDSYHTSAAAAAATTRRSNKLLHALLARELSPARQQTRVWAAYLADVAAKQGEEGGGGEAGGEEARVVVVVDERDGAGARACIHDARAALRHCRGVRVRWGAGNAVRQRVRDEWRIRYRKKPPPPHHRRLLPLPEHSTPPWGAGAVLSITALALGPWLTWSCIDGLGGGGGGGLLLWLGGGGGGGGGGAEEAAAAAGWEEGLRGLVSAAASGAVLLLYLLFLSACLYWG